MRNQRTNKWRRRATNLGAAASAAIVGLGWHSALAETSTDSANGPSYPAVTITLSGSTAMRNFTISSGITLLSPGQSITLSNGKSAVAPLGDANNPTSFQMARSNFT